MVQVELWKDNEGAIERMEGFGFGRGVGGIGMASTANIKEGVEMRHVRTHIAGPFEDLGMNVGQKSIRGPVSQDHDLGSGDVGKEENHGGAGADGLVSNFVGMKAKMVCPHVNGR